MANTQSSFGFRHIGFTSGGSPDYQLATRLISSANTTKIFRGDPVQKIASSKYIGQAVATATDPLVGVFDGCVYIPVGGGTPIWSPFWPGTAASDATAYVINAPNAMFLAASLLAPTLASYVGENVEFDIGTGNTTTGFSGATIDASTHSTTTALSFQVYGLYQGIGNGSDSTSNYNWACVTFNNMQFKTQTGVA